MSKRYGMVGLFMLLPLFVHAQGSPEYGLLPALNINKKLPKDWRINFKLESRQSVFKETLDYDYLLTDWSLSATRKIAVRSALSGGYLMRIDDQGIRHRVLQQLSLVNRFDAFSLAQRLAADQTFQKGREPEFRYRYRISSEVPLSGQSLDPGEFFVKLSNEYLHAFQGGEYDLEIRLGGFLGFAIAPASKVEAGLDYRTDSFLSGQTRNRIWIGINFYQSI